MAQQHSLTILGATGSVGKSTLELVREQPSRFAIKGLTAHTNYRELARLAHEFKPDNAVIADERFYQPLKESLLSTDITVHAGKAIGPDDVEIIVFYAGRKGSPTTVLSE